MCYSAQIQASYRKYVRDFGAHISFERLVDLFWEKATRWRLVEAAQGHASGIRGADQRG